MSQTATAFHKINAGYNATFKPGRLSVGLFLPLEEYGTGDLPTLERHIARAQLAESLGFSALWLRDVPFNVPAFGDVGQMLDPFVYLGLLAAKTNRIALGVGSLILPLRHPAHVAKAASTVDLLSNGRLLLGIASGDRPEEYPALASDYEGRGARFRDAVDYIRATWDSFPQFENPAGTLNGHLDMLPKPPSGRFPMLITGGSQQSPDWGAAHADGWITYPRKRENQAQMIAEYRARVQDAGAADKPVIQSLFVDVKAKNSAPTRPLALGWQAGTPFLRDHLKELEEIGVNHVALNLRYNYADTEETLHRIAEEILPAFA